MKQSGFHFHGFGPWVGPPDTFERQNEGKRRPTDPGFLQSTAPPIELANYLLRRTQARRDLTWIDVDGAVAWLLKNYAEHPPDARLNNGDRETQNGFTRAGLMGGSDAYWSYSLSSERRFAIAVIVCPNRFYPNHPCPLPPS